MKLFSLWSVRFNPNIYISRIKEGLRMEPFDIIVTVLRVFGRIRPSCQW